MTEHSARNNFKGKNKWQNQRIHSHFKNQKKDAYKHYDRRWNRKHSNSANLKNGRGPNGCRCCAILDGSHRTGPATDGNRRKLSTDPQVRAFTKVDSIRKCLFSNKINTNDAKIELQKHKLQNCADVPSDDCDTTLVDKHSTITLNDYLPTELRQYDNININDNNYPDNYDTFDAYGTILNIDKVMIALHHNEYGTLSNRFTNLLYKYPIIQQILPHLHRIRRLFKDMNFDTIVDSLIKKKFAAKLNNIDYGSFDIMWTNKTHLWTQFDSQVTMNGVDDISLFDDAVIRISGIQCLIHGFWRKRNKMRQMNIPMDVVHLCLAFCNVVRMTDDCPSLLPYNFNVKQYYKKRKLMIQCCNSSSNSYVKQCEKLFVCVIFKGTKDKDSGVQFNMYPFGNIVPILCINRVERKQMKQKYGRRGFVPSLGRFKLVERGNVVVNYKGWADR